MLGWCERKRVARATLKSKWKARGSYLQLVLTSLRLRRRVEKIDGENLECGGSAEWQPSIR